MKPSKGWSNFQTKIKINVVGYNILEIYDDELADDIQIDIDTKEKAKGLDAEYIKHISSPNKIISVKEFCQKQIDAQDDKVIEDKVSLQVSKEMNKKNGYNPKSGQPITMPFNFNFDKKNWLMETNVGDIAIKQIEVMVRMDIVNISEKKY